MQKKKKKIITGPITNGSDVLNNILICHYRQFSPHYVSFEIAFGKIHEENQKQKKNRISNYRFCSTTPYKFMRCHKPKIRARHIYFSYKLCYTSNDFHTDFQFRFNFFLFFFRFSSLKKSSTVAIWQSFPITIDLYRRNITDGMTSECAHSSVCLLCNSIACVRILRTSFFRSLNLLLFDSLRKWKELLEHAMDVPDEKDERKKEEKLLLNMFVDGCYCCCCF